MKLSEQQRAKIDSCLAAHIEWQRGAITEREYLRRADILDAEHAAIEKKLSSYASQNQVVLAIANVLYPVG